MMSLRCAKLQSGVYTHRLIYSSRELYEVPLRLLPVYGQGEGGEHLANTSLARTEQDSQPGSPAPEPTLH